LLRAIDAKKCSNLGVRFFVKWGSGLSSKDDLIFVSIASYRDLQLGPTVRDCLGKAEYKDRIRFGICWQHGEEETEPPFATDDPRFRVLDVPFRESRGVCWARAEIMKLWQGEHWFLQIDSHCRLVYGWDRKLIEMAEGLRERRQVAKPLLSTYAMSFKPGRLEILAGEPGQIAFQAFTWDSIPQLKPAGFGRSVDRKSEEPVPARFVAAGFLFAEGRFIEDVPYDPEIYFLGEEATMTVRAYTHGYDLFHPGTSVVWHDYGRLDAKRHWGDHTEAAQAPRVWTDMDKRSRDKVRRLLTGEPVASYGLGNVRTLEDYEAYAGLSFKLRKAHPYTMLGEPPPNPVPPVDWADSIYPWIAKIVVEREALPEAALVDPSLWCLTFADTEGNEIIRLDASSEELEPFRDAEGPIVFTCEFPSATIPATWTVSPMSRSRGWLPMVSGALGKDDFAVLDEAADVVEQD
jgi:hypothetical protein